MSDNIIDTQKITLKLSKNCRSSNFPTLLADEVYTTHTEFTSEKNKGSALSCATTIGFIDKHSFIRECIAATLQSAGTNLDIVPHASCVDILKNKIRYDLVLFHCHREDIEGENSELSATEFKSVTELGPIIILSAIEDPKFITFAFQNGVRGYIPTRNTPMALIIEIMNLVKAGGTFVPLSGLQINGSFPIDESIKVSSSRELTPREEAVFKLLKLGKANKLIAHELKLSENTIKAYVRNIMKKMNARNRTEAVSRYYNM